MRRTFLSTITAVLLAILIGGSAPGLALAHGHAHHEAAEHDSGRADFAPSTAGGTQSEDDPSGTLQSGREPGDHAHPELSQPLTARANPYLLAVTVRLLAGAERVVFLQTPSHLHPDKTAPASPADQPPRQPRAPPTV